MKDMFDFCRDQKVGPIEALKSYPYQMRTGKLQIPEMEQLANASRGLAPDMNNGFFSTEVDESMGFPWKA
ncbi:hypothetical protein YC2023_072736 [Brassica napus]